MDDGVEALAGFVGAEGGADKVAERVGQRGEDCNLLLNSVLVTEMRAAPRPRRGEEFFQPNDLGWLDSCDEHRNEEIKKAAAGIPNFSRIRRVLLRQIAITNFINPC
jgi:hypothetical protein